MTSNTTDNVTLRKSISLVLNSTLFRKIVQGIITSEYEKTVAGIDQQVSDVLSNLDRFIVEDDSITTVKLKDNSVTANKLATESVTTEKLATESVTEEKLATESVTTDKIADNSVTSDKLAPLSITDKHIALGSISLSALSPEFTVKLNNIENYSRILSSTYKIIDENGNNVVFNAENIDIIY
jgi:hypothetical protein